MAESTTAIAETAAQEYQYTVRVEDAGPATKKVFVEIPRDRIEAKLAAQFKEMRSQAAIPGFRAGKAPISLIQKKFGGEIKEQVRRQLIGESYEQAISKNDLKVLGEPEFDDVKAVSELPETGNISYSLTVEIQPAFTMPNLEGVAITKPKIEVTDTNVDQAMSNLRQQQGALVPVEGAAEPKDFLVGDFTLKVEGAVIGTQPGAQLVVADGRIAGVEIAQLESKLVGIKPGETKVLEADVPADHPQKEIACKSVQIEIKINDIKRLELAVIDEDFLESLGFKNEAELREALREQLISRIEFDVAEAMRNQARKYLIENTTIDLPSKLTERQSNRVVQRRAIDLMQRGVPQAQLEANIEALKQGSIDEARAELKMFFVLQQIANDGDIEVDESELNGRISMIAAMRGERPEKLKTQMSKDGSLSNLYLQLREQKALDTIVDKAVITEKPVGEDVAPAAEAK